MQFLSNMKIGMRLTSAFVLLMLMLIGIALVGLSGIGKTFNSLVRHQRKAHGIPG